MLPDRVSNPGPLTYESGALPIALRGPAHRGKVFIYKTSVATVNFVLNKLLLILLIIKNIHKIIYLSF